MQTIYNRICQTDPEDYGEGKIIDLADYRRQWERAQRREAREREPLEVQPRPRSSQRRNRWGLFWDAVASVGVLVLALTFCAELLL